MNDQWATILLEKQHDYPAAQALGYSGVLRKRDGEYVELLATPTSSNGIIVQTSDIRIVTASLKLTWWIYKRHLINNLLKPKNWVDFIERWVCNTEERMNREDLVTALGNAYAEEHKGILTGETYADAVMVLIEHWKYGKELKEWYISTYPQIRPTLPDKPSQKSHFPSPSWTGMLHRFFRSFRR